MRSRIRDTEKNMGLNRVGILGERKQPETHNEPFLKNNPLLYCFASHARKNSKCFSKASNSLADTRFDKND